MLRLAAPGPVMVTLWLIYKLALVSVIVPVTAKLIVSPDAEAAIVSRSEPAPLSLRLVTVSVLATAGMGARHSKGRLNASDRRQRGRLTVKTEKPNFCSWGFVV